MRRFMVAVALVVVMNVPCYAGLRVVGEAGFREYDPANFPPDKKLSYKTMKSRCTRCHSLDRVVQAIGTGIAPDSWMPFDQNSARAYGESRMRKANESMSPAEIQSIVDLMQWLITAEREKYLPQGDD